MKNIGIITNNEKDVGFAYTNMLIESIRKFGGQAVIPTRSVTKGMEGLDNEVEEICSKCELIICLGGDGTFLKTARTAYLYNLPILGINLGSLGFLTDIEKGEIDKAVESIFQNNYIIEERMMLSSRIYKEGKLFAEDVAINDVSISRAGIPRILHLSTYIDDNFFDMFPGDGIVVATPTGSTAYSMSAGGPIAEPTSKLIIVTPICPHMLYSRSFVASEERRVKVSVSDGFEHKALVTVDGQKNYEITGGDYIEIEKAASKVKILKIHSKNFFTVLRNKIYDRKEE
ncbi:NAD(+)/NADH kinase [Ruminiclostridium cellobioparum]|jgi:NAD+ kinase|uniref:NAD kinase n=2 Tax=Ruminiclostridium cellobioparum TaxID=29355 RepID=S0FJJ8_RUMCE|nr:NAD(+)/NADH kinase [Ruminiclostridium cellobioparum]EMS71927.1 putative sugar kinase [Ruminiclostridium cellobioparum subsp. termitidis CT1112]